MAAVYKIKNVSDTAYRFTPVLKFIPGETTVVSDADMKSKPVIELLMKSGQLKMVGGQGKKDKEVIEEV